tara:strand:- start:246 stop:593 length:348 start_codon:yes stop_codon:yes gene_type:complete
MDTDINKLLKSRDDKPHESNIDNTPSITLGGTSLIANLAKRFKVVFIVLYYINVVLIIGFVIFASIGILASYTPNVFVLFILIGGAIAYIINIFSFGFIATIMKIQEDLENLAKN